MDITCIQIVVEDGGVQMIIIVQNLKKMGSFIYSIGKLFKSVIQDGYNYLFGTKTNSTTPMHQAPMVHIL